MPRNNNPRTEESISTLAENSTMEKFFSARCKNRLQNNNQNTIDNLFHAFEAVNKEA